MDEYLRLSSCADRQQLSRIKQVMLRIVLDQYQDLVLMMMMMMIIITIIVIIIIIIITIIIIVIITVLMWSMSLIFLCIGDHFLGF